MNSKLLSVIILLCDGCNNVGIPSKKFETLVYLCDWKHCVDYGKQITGVSWYYASEGPTFAQIANLAPLWRGSLFHDRIKKIKIRKGALDFVSLNYNEHQSVNHVIKTANSMSDKELLRLVFSTYPIIISDRYSYLNLEKLSNEYRIY